MGERRACDSVRAHRWSAVTAKEIAGGYPRQMEDYIVGAGTMQFPKFAIELMDHSHCLECRPCSVEGFSAARLSIEDNFPREQLHEMAMEASFQVRLAQSERIIFQLFGQRQLEQQVSCVVIGRTETAPKIEASQKIPERLVMGAH